MIKFDLGFKDWREMCLFLFSQQCESCRGTKKNFDYKKCESCPKQITMHRLSFNKEVNQKPTEKQIKCQL